MRNYLSKLFRLIRSILNGNYFKARKNIFLIYTLSKVGSSTVRASLQRALPTIRVHQLHWMDHDRIAALDEITRPNAERNAAHVREVIQEHPGKRLKIITLVRDPIARQISAKLHTLNKRLSPDETKRQEVSSILDALTSQDFGFSEDWFRTEFSAFTGENVFDNWFDRNLPYTISKTREFDVLCIKLESLNLFFESAIREFAGLKNIRMVVRNEASDKPIARLYREVNKSFRLPENRLREIYSMGYVVNFYSDSEIEHFINCWKER